MSLSRPSTPTNQPTKSGSSLNIKKQNQEAKRVTREEYAKYNLDQIIPLNLEETNETAVVQRITSPTPRRCLKFTFDE